MESAPNAGNSNDVRFWKAFSFAALAGMFVVGFLIYSIRSDAAVTESELADFQADRLKNIDNQFNASNYTHEELSDITEAQRARAYEAYALESYFCTTYMGIDDFKWADAKTTYSGTTITTEITCAHGEGDDTDTFVIVYDQLSGLAKVNPKGLDVSPASFDR